MPLVLVPAHLHTSGSGENNFPCFLEGSIIPRAGNLKLGTATWSPVQYLWYLPPSLIRPHRSSSESGGFPLQHISHQPIFQGIASYNAMPLVLPCPPASLHGRGIRGGREPSSHQAGASPARPHRGTASATRATWKPLQSSVLWRSNYLNRRLQ